jgi:hypothetical protein
MSNFLLGIFFTAVVIGLIGMFARNSNPLDDTDNKLTGARSDMRILVDHGTGCQYLRSSGGGLTPRLDKDGKPMCGVKHE